jgi:hypothetical protein
VWIGAAEDLKFGPVKRIVLMIVVAACSKSGDQKSGSSTSEDKPAKEGCQISGAKTADLVSGKTVAPLAPFTGVKLGMSPADAAKACPNLFEDKDRKKAGRFSVGGIVGKLGTASVYGRLNFERDKVVQIDMTLPKDSADALTAAWGAPKKSGEQLLWFDDATGIRARLQPPERDERELEISSYAPLAAFVETDPKTIAWKPAAVLGVQSGDFLKSMPQYAHPDDTSAEVKKQTEAMMADMKKDLEAKGVDTSSKGADIEVELPATPYGEGTTTKVILYNNDDGTVRSYGVWFRSKGWPDEIKDVLKRLDDTLGPHKMVNEVLGARHTWNDPKTGIRASARVEASKPDELDVNYVRYLPLASFFGEPGPVWGFEKPKPVLGATVEELTAAYGKALKVDEKNNTATLTFPPTDYDGDTSTTTILLFLEGGKVREWHTNLPFEDFEGAKAEYEAALDAKLGAPKPGKYDHLVYGKGIEVEYSEITHQLDIEVKK